MRTAIGLIAGPDSPPVTLVSRGLRVSTSIDMARKVFTRLTASAPDAAHTRAMLRDGGDVGRELHHQRALRDVLDLVHQIFERAGVGTEGHAAGMHVGAGDVQLIGGDAVGVVQALDDRFVIGHRVAEHVDDDLAGGIAAERRQFLLDELDDADVLQPDGVEHACGGLDNAWRGMSLHRFQRDALGDKGADPLQRNDLFKFDAVAERAAGGDHRVVQLDPGELHFHVGFHARIFPSKPNRLLRQSSGLASTPL